MKQFKALLMKDYHVNRKGLFIPIWIVAGAYILSLVGVLIALINGHTDISLGGIPIEYLNNQSMHRALSFALQVGMFFSFTGVIVAISTLSISSGLLNQDVKYKCELFHRSQPVNVWKLTVSRFVAGIGGAVVLSLLLGLFNFIVINLMVSIITPLRIDWWLAINGLILSWLHLSVILLVCGSIGYLLSSIFRDNAMGKGILGIAGVEIVIRALNLIYNTAFPSLVENILKLVMSGFTHFEKTLAILKYGAVSFSSPGTSSTINAFAPQSKGLVANAFGLPANFLGTLWGTLFTWNMGFKILFVVVMYVLATCIYQRREVQF